MKNSILFLFIIFIFSCQSPSQKPINHEAAQKVNDNLSATHVTHLPYPDSLFQTFEMTEGNITYVMKKYFIAFLKEGPNREQSEAEAEKIQKAHLNYLGKLANEKRACMIGPFGEDADSEIQGIIVFSVPDKAEAERLAQQDPAVKAGRLVIEVQPWWAAKGSELF